MEGLASVQFSYVKRPINLESHMYKVTKIERTLTLLCIFNVCHFVTTRF